jgi:hypothetical protein
MALSEQRMAETAPPTPGLALSTDEFERALGLLEQAERAGRPYAAGPLATHLLFTLAGVVGVFACPLGALIRLVDVRLGQPLLVVGLAATALFTLLSTRGRDGTWLSLDMLRAAATGHDPLDAGAEAGRRGRLVVLGVRVLLALGALSLVGGAAWLVYSVLALRVANTAALALAAWPLLVVTVFTAIRGYREHAFYAGAARLRRTFAARYVEARRAEQAEVALSEAEARALGPIQKRLLRGRNSA